MSTESTATPRAAARQAATSATGTKPKVMRPVNADIDRARSFKPSADRVRGQAMLDVASGHLDVNDVIVRAMTPGGEPLHKLSLQSLLAQRSGTFRARRTLSVLAARLDLRIDTKAMTVAWLIDPRSRAKRYHAWLQVLAEMRTPLGDGFPHSRLETTR